jgi:hypothetical protein
MRRGGRPLVNVASITLRTWRLGQIWTPRQLGNISDFGCHSTASTSPVPTGPGPNGCLMAGFARRVRTLEPGAGSTTCFGCPEIVALAATARPGPGQAMADGGGVSSPRLSAALAEGQQSEVQDAAAAPRTTTPPAPSIGGRRNARQVIRTTTCMVAGAGHGEPLHLPAGPLAHVFRESASRGHSAPTAQARAPAPAPGLPRRSVRTPAPSARRCLPNGARQARSRPVPGRRPESWDSGRIRLDRGAAEGVRERPGVGRRAHRGDGPK